MKKNKKGFTLIELLVVISIIGLLSTLAVLALNNARQKSRDARRLADVRQVQTALGLYYHDNSAYPPSAALIFKIGTFAPYMSILPGNPIPKTDGGCPDSEYDYDQDGGGVSYHITYCLGALTAGVAKGPQTATPAGIDN